jgi:hypothetical protein
MDLQELWCENENSIHHLPQYMVDAGSCKHSSKPMCSTKLENSCTSCTTINSSKAMFQGVTYEYNNGHAHLFGKKYFIQSGVLNN